MFFKKKQRLTELTINHILQKKKKSKLLACQVDIFQFNFCNSKIVLIKKWLLYRQTFILEKKINSIKLCISLTNAMKKAIKDLHR